jgi:Protein of unknown function (DUF2844)
MEYVRMLTRPGFGPKYLSLAAALLVATLAPHSARATLGEPETTIAADAAELKGSVKSTEQTNYRVHEIQLPSGTVLREFVTPGGSVFAVAWSGPSMPNLQQTLGSYFNTFVAAAKAPHGGHHMLQVQQDRFVMQSSGHMRAFSGRAYLPQALPAGVSLDELH